VAAQPLRSTTPRAISGAVKRFLGSLESAVNPVFLPFTFASTDYIAGHCHQNCEAEHKRTGAEIVFGWMVWEDEAASFIEAEFHSVIRRGRHLKDITPRRDGEKRILFAPDVERSAVRVEDRTWRIWNNHKAIGSEIVQFTHAFTSWNKNGGSDIWPDPPPSR
jgi:hypothetical protein